MSIGSSYQPTGRYMQIIASFSPFLKPAIAGLHVISCCLRVYNDANEDYKGLVRRL